MLLRGVSDKPIGKQLVLGTYLRLEIRIGRTSKSVIFGKYNSTGGQFHGIRKHIIPCLGYDVLKTQETNSATTEAEGPLHPQGQLRISHHNSQQWFCHTYVLMMFQLFFYSSSIVSRP